MLQPAVTIHLHKDPRHCVPAPSKTVYWLLDLTNHAPIETYNKLEDISSLSFGP